MNIQQQCGDPGVGGCVEGIAAGLPQLCLGNCFFRYFCGDGAKY